MSAGSELQLHGKKDGRELKAQLRRCPVWPKPKSEAAEAALLPLSSSLIVFPKPWDENNGP